jgi:hypothetical protein
MSPPWTTRTVQTIFRKTSEPSGMLAFDMRTNAILARGPNHRIGRAPGYSATGMGIMRRVSYERLDSPPYRFAGF